MPLSASAPRPRDSLSQLQARRIALAAQGFTARRPAEEARPQHLHRTAERLGAVQIDSVNVLVRSHYLPFHSRLGSYSTERLERLAYGGRRRRLFEYWGHECSFLPVVLQPFFRWRMTDARAGRGLYSGLARFGREQKDFIARVLAEVEARGPISAGELEDAGGKGAGGWWGWSDGKRAMEWLFWAGLVTTATRRSFERFYDLPDRVLPHEVLAMPTPPAAEAQRRLLRHAAEALGVATARDLRDYFRLPVEATRRALAELVEAGELLPVTVQGWRQPAYFAAGAHLPRRVEAEALLSPFDSLIWQRDRTEQLFGFHYRLALYTPAEDRRHGYYVLPFLLGERLAARVDLKSDRAGGRLLVLAAHGELDAPPEIVAEPLARALARLADWLGLGDVSVSRRGDLAGALRRALR